MTNEQKENKTNFQNYAYAGLAAQLAQSKEGQVYLGGALDLLEKNIAEEEVDLFRGYINDGQIESLINIENKKFQRKRGEANFSEFYSAYESGLEGASNEQKALFKAEFDKFPGKTYGEVTGRARHLYYLAKEAPESEVNKEEKEEAEKELKKYQGILAALEKIEGYYFENLRVKAVEESKKKNFGGLEKMLKGEVKAE